MIYYFFEEKVGFYVILIVEAGVFLAKCFGSRILVVQIFLSWKIIMIFMFYSAERFPLYRFSAQFSKSLFDCIAKI